MSKQTFTTHLLIAALATVSIAGQAMANRELPADRAPVAQAELQPAALVRPVEQAPLAKVSDREVSQPRALAPTALLLTCHRAGSRMVC